MSFSLPLTSFNRQSQSPPRTHRIRLFIYLIMRGSHQKSQKYLFFLYHICTTVISQSICNVINICLFVSLRESTIFILITNTGTRKQKKKKKKKTSVSRLVSLTFYLLPLSSYFHNFLLLLWSTTNSFEVVVTQYSHCYEVLSY